MTLEEAIIHCEEKACGNTQCALEHKQLAEWLKELQELRRYCSDTKTIEERAKEYAKRRRYELTAYESYMVGATEQKAIDEEVRLKKCDDMTEAEYEREVAFADWYNKNGKGTPTYSNAIEWARRELIDEACEIVRNIANEYFGDWEQSCKVEDTFRKAMEE